MLAQVIKSFGIALFFCACAAHLTPAGHALQDAGIDATQVRCRSDVLWNPTVMNDAQAATRDILEGLAADGEAVQRIAAQEKLAETVRWWMIRTVILSSNSHNFDVVALNGVKNSEGKPVLLFRTGITPHPEEVGSCFQSLLANAGVRHVVNLYEGKMPATDLANAERQTLESFGGVYYEASRGSDDEGQWRARLKANNTPAEQRNAMQVVARIINEQILRPAGNLPRGNILIHCGGGMHRTGMIVGVIERCINGASQNDIESHYKAHTAWQSDAFPGGFEQGNLDFIRAFDCNLLKR